MPHRTRRELAVENAVLFGKLEQVRDDLDEFLDDASDEEFEEETDDEDDAEESGDEAPGSPAASSEDKED